MADLIFRNLDVSPGDPVETWPTEAIATALERGGIEHWARLVTAIRARPWGDLARTVESVLTYSRPYGVTPLFERALVDARAASAAADRAAAAEEVRGLLSATGMTQAAAARELGTSASRLSTYASGAVSPSAAFMVALRRLADRGHASTASVRR